MDRSILTQLIMLTAISKLFLKKAVQIECDFQCRRKLYAHWSNSHPLIHKHTHTHAHIPTETPDSAQKETDTYTETHNDILIRACTHRDIHAYTK